MLANADFRPARRAWLLAIALGHLALLMAWRPALQRAADVTARPEGELVLLTLPPAARARPEPARPAVSARPTRPAPPPAAARLDAPPASAEAAPQSITLPAAADPADPFAKPLPRVESLLEKNRKMAAGVDRQLRKESLNKFATIIQPDTSLGMAIAKSQTREWVLKQTSDVGDGVVMKRYRKGNLEYCEYTNLVGARGQDPFRDGNKTKVMTCP